MEINATSHISFQSLKLNEKDCQVPGHSDVNSCWVCAFLTLLLDTDLETCTKPWHLLNGNTVLGSGMHSDKDERISQQKAPAHTFD